MSIVSISDTLVGLIQNNGTLAVILLMFLEEIFFIIPSSVISISAGALLVDAEFLPAALIEMNLEVVIPATAAITAGSYFVYFIVYYFGKSAIERFGGYAGVEWEDIQYLEYYLDHDREKYYLAFLRATPFIPITTISAAAGLFRINWKTYGVWTFIGMYFRNFLYALLGWTFKDSYHLIQAQISSISSTFTTIVVSLIVFYLIYRKVEGFFKRKMKHHNPNYDL